MNDTKIIMLVTGPIIKYRMELYYDSSPNVVKEKVIFFTDEFSYNLVPEYHNIFNFVLIDDIQKNYPKSIKCELLIKENDESKYYEKIRTFYSHEKGVLYPYDIVRFIFIYLANNNILNFIIMDSDCVLIDDVDLIEKTFNSLPSGSFHMPLFGDSNNLESCNDFFIKNFNEKYQNFNFRLEKMITADGYIKGFHFKNKDDLLMFFNLWNESIEILISNYFDSNNLVSSFIGLIYDTFWILPYIMQIFEKNKNYIFSNTFSHTFQDNFNVFQHISRPEEKLYYKLEGEHWYKQYGLDYDTPKTVNEFVKINKNPLYEFYRYRILQNAKLNITDTHVHIKIATKHQ